MLYKYFIGYQRISDLTQKMVDRSSPTDSRKLYIVNPNYRFGIPIPSNLSEEIEAAMLQGIPLLHLAIARQGAKCFNPTSTAMGNMAEDIDLVQAILTQPELNIHAKGCYGETALHHAVTALDFETCRIL